MIQIEDTIVSLDVIEKQFCCDVFACKGACCVVGDSGAPLETEEVMAIEDALPSILELLSEKSVQVINMNGVAMIDSDGDIVTVLVENKECAFAIFNNGITECAIEKSWEMGNGSLQKPISCHLYPIRLKKYKNYTAVNFHQWEICKPAILKGQSEKGNVYKFAKTPLIKKFGQEWYNQLCIAADYVFNNKIESEPK